jgi:hypothetical protein
MNQDEPSQEIEGLAPANTNKSLGSGGVQSYQPLHTAEPEVVFDVNFKAPDELLQAQSLANLLDTAVKVPFINFRVGLDFLIGLIPVIGDSITLLASFRIIYLAHKMGIPGAFKYKMLGNTLIDYGLGLVPILGDLVDMIFKGNQRNVRILEKWWVSENKAQIDALAKHQFDAWQKEQDKE